MCSELCFRRFRISNQFSLWRQMFICLKLVFGLDKTWHYVSVIFNDNLLLTLIHFFYSITHLAQEHIFATVQSFGHLSMKKFHMKNICLPISNNAMQATSYYSIFSFPCNGKSTNPHRQRIQNISREANY